MVIAEHLLKFKCLLLTKRARNIIKIATRRKVNMNLHLNSLRYINAFIFQVDVQVYVLQNRANQLLQKKNICIQLLKTLLNYNYFWMKRNVVSATPCHTVPI